MADAKLEYSNTTTLAYLGDAIYEVYVREYVLKKEQTGADKLHRAAVRYVKAGAQAAALKSQLDQLSETELGLVKRARNKKITSKPQNADPVSYKWATAFEALVGYLYLSKNEKRLKEILEATLKFIDKPQEKKHD